jgi:anti-sigma regulatory factor (Ser/Thr protein kinase)
MDSDDPEPDGSGLELRLKPRTDAAAEAREAIRERLSASLPAPTLDDLLTVVTELVTNSVRHGPGASIELRVEVAADGAVRGMVADQGEGKVAIRETRTPGTGGIGLRLVDSIADHWGVYEGSTHVWFELRAPTARFARR